ncbi:MAG: succinate--CoA ligase subunit beta, partial [Thermoplasmata archaeon]
MYLYEYQAKRLLKEYGVDVPSSVFIEAESLFQGSEQDLKKGLDAHLSDRVVVKVQILEGGRG